MTEDYKYFEGVDALFEQVLLEQCSEVGCEGMGARKVGGGRKTWVHCGANLEAELEEGLGRPAVSSSLQST